MSKISLPDEKRQEKRVANPRKPAKCVVDPRSVSFSAKLSKISDTLTAEELADLAISQKFTATKLRIVLKKRSLPYLIDLYDKAAKIQHGVMDAIVNQDEEALAYFERVLSRMKISMAELLAICRKYTGASDSLKQAPGGQDEGLEEPPDSYTDVSEFTGKIEYIGPGADLPVKVCG